MKRKRVTTLLYLFAVMTLVIHFVDSKEMMTIRAEQCLEVEREDILSSLYIEAADTITFEYGEPERIRYSDYMLKYSGSPFVVAPGEEKDMFTMETFCGKKIAGNDIINYYQVGEKTVQFSVSDEMSNGEIVSIKKDVLFKIEDTHPPVISLNDDSVYVYLGNSFSPRSNINDVYDKIDGSLSYADELTEGTYTVSTNYSDAVGTYEVWIEAMDINGNQSSSSYQVNVVNKPRYGEFFNFSVMGSDGAVICGYYQAKLIAPSWSGIQGVINRRDAAGYQYNLFGYGKQYIADHNVQGFDATRYYNYLYIKRPNGSIETYVKIAGYYTGKTWYVNGHPIYSSYGGQLLTQTCAGGGLYFALWNRQY